MLPILILCLGLLGHLILWVALVNRAHALGMRRRWVHLLTLSCIFMFAAMPLIILAALVYYSRSTPTPLATMLYAAAWLYVAACAVVCIVASIQRLLWRFHGERKGVLASNHTTRIDLAAHCTQPLISPGVAIWLNRVPGNQILTLYVQEKHLVIPGLPAGHEGLRVAHLSDLHMSGRMTRSFYEYVVDETNRCQPDFIAITGDLVDADECIDWIPDVLGRLRAPHGVFYVFGNHDRRVNQDRLKTALAKTDWVHVGTAPLMRTMRDLQILLGGNERPWLGTPTDFNTLPPPHGEARPLRIALSHSPDQIDWACANDVDLVLAGHVHGGQICLPVLGPFTAPSMHGVRYAAGTFRVRETVLHVSRGTASLTPIRWGCPPEVAILQLTPPMGD